MAHGLLGSAYYYDDMRSDNMLYDAKAIEIAKRVCSEGIPVISTDLGGTSTWGNNICQLAMNDTITFFHQKTGARDSRVMLLGESMGAATVLNWAHTNPSKVAAIALLVPTVNLSDIYDNNRNGLKSVIDSSYSDLLVYPSGFSGAASSVDPSFYARSFTNIPIHIWYSSNDPICVPSVVTSWGIAAGATMTDMGAIGHSISSLNIETVADWLAQYR